MPPGDLIVLYIKRGGGGAPHRESVFCSGAGTPYHPTVGNSASDVESDALPRSESGTYSVRIPGRDLTTNIQKKATVSLPWVLLDLPSVPFGSLPITVLTAYGNLEQKAEGK